MLMKRLGYCVAALALLAMGGCVTMPTGPSVLVLPAPGKQLDQFRSEDLTCRQWGRPAGWHKLAGCGN